MSGKPRLLFVVNQTEFFLSHRLPLALAAQHEGYEVHIATPTSPGVTAIREKDLLHHDVPFSRRGMHPLKEAATLRALLRLYRSVRPDIVHHVTIKPVLYGSLMARLTGVPGVVNAVSGLGYVFISRGFRAILLRSVVRAAYRLALHHGNSRVIFQNRDDPGFFAQKHLIDAERAVVIKGSGVELDRFVPTPEPSDPPVVMFASRLLRDKGVREFVEAAGTLRRSGVQARFVLVGDIDPGNPASLSTETVKGWCDESTIEWWGRRDDMPHVLAQAHIVCLPSYREGLPKILIEAAACGRPIVATDVPGCREIVRDGENGLLVTVRNAEALSAAIKKLIEEPLLRRRMGEQGRRIAAQEFGLEQVIAETLLVYQGLLKKNDPYEIAKTRAPTLSDR
jgi:glycosyltransferase involved in cell wall biosynthesis